MPSGRLRVAGPGDLDGILALEEASFPPEDRFPRRSWRRLLASPSALCLVIDERTCTGPDGRTIHAAIAWLLRSTSSLARMYTLAVHPAARGRSLARTLVAASLARLPARVDRLGLEVRCDNAAAVGLYCAIGFIETARVPAYYGRGRDGIRMRAARSTVADMLQPTT